MPGMAVPPSRAEAGGVDGGCGSEKNSRSLCGVSDGSPGTIGFDEVPDVSCVADGRVAMVSWAEGVED